MSDTPEELRRAQYLADNDLGVCCECGEDVPNDEITKDLGDDVCKGCHDGAARKCIECGQAVGHWYGTETRAGFICDDNHAKKPAQGIEDQLTDESRERDDWAMDHKFESPEAEARYIEEQREHIRKGAA